MLFPGLRQNEDLRSLFFMACCTFLFIIPYLITISGFSAFIWVLAASFFCFVTSIINHNHQHLGIAKNDSINKGISFYLSLLRGHSAYSIRLAHNANHHRYNCREEDWIRPSLAGSGAGIVRLFRFVYKSSQEMTRGKNIEEGSFYKAKDKRQLRLERWGLRILAVILLLINWQVTLLFTFIPWVIGVFSLIAINLMQHDQCDFTSRYNHSRNFVSRFGNWFLLNNGYHTVHHLYPKSHWSDLPELHQEKVEPHIKPELDEPSLLRFLIKNYGFGPTRILAIEH